MSEAPTLLLGDCLDVMARDLGPESIDACVTDPPYGLGFMGKHWDKGVPDADVWREVYRVLKPGAHLLSFFGTRTYHRGVTAIEDAGFEIRDQILWIYGQGFPKSLDISKAIDKAEGAEREQLGLTKGCGSNAGTGRYNWNSASDGIDRTQYQLTAPTTEAARQWNGWGTALKPATEPIVVARKPLDGTVAQNVLKWGTGGINVDGCRVPHSEECKMMAAQTDVESMTGAGRVRQGGRHKPMLELKPAGRWPGNLIHDGSDEVLEEFAKYGERSSGAMRPTHVRNTGRSAARFFYTAKASKDDRNDGLHEYEHTDAADMVDREPGSDGMNSPRAGAGRTSGARNHHPTVKPVSLMRYLVRLVTPKGGLVLDPFAGSGSTLIAAYREDCRAIGIELDPEYHRMAFHRIDKATAQLRLSL